MYANDQMYADDGTNPGGTTSPQQWSPDGMPVNDWQTTQMPTGWDQIAGAYGLGAPPAVGMPSVMPGVSIGAPPMLSTDMNAFNDYMNQINGQIGGAYGFDTPYAQTSLIDRGAVPQVEAQQYGTSAELQKLLSGQGYDPAILAKMKGNAIDQTSQAGLQQMSQMKRILGESGIRGGAEAAVRGNVARDVGRQQGEALNSIDVGNANLANQNFTTGVNLQTQIGMGNMQQANMMALENANKIFEALRSNQTAQNSMNQFNTGNKFQQQMTRAGAQAGFLGQQGSQGQNQRWQNENENANKQWQQKQLNTGYDWERQKAQWDELNRRFSQAQGTLGQWGTS
jgi:hypothetical protein